MRPRNHEKRERNHRCWLPMPLWGGLSGDWWETEGGQTKTCFHHPQNLVHGYLMTRSFWGCTFCLAGVAVKYFWYIEMSTEATGELAPECINFSLCDRRHNLQVMRWNNILAQQGCFKRPLISSLHLAWFVKLTGGHMSWESATALMEGSNQLLNSVKLMH